MTKHCTNCGKTVYPVEELKTGDQVWHKGCFRCTTCSLQLTLKNFKIHEKRPYCTTHYPTMHAFTVVKDTPENQRVQKTMDVVSQAKYQGYRERRERGEEQRAAGDFEHTSSNVNPSFARPAAPQPQPPLALQPQAQSRAPMSYGAPDQTSYQQPSEPAYPMSGGGGGGIALQPSAMPGFGQPFRPPGGMRVLPPSGGDGGGTVAPQPQMQMQMRPSPEQQLQPQMQPFSYAPPPRMPSQSQAAQLPPEQSQPMQMQMGGAYRPAAAPAPAAPAPRPAAPQQPLFRALYPYTAADTDEVSFAEGDVILGGEVPSEGWMFGTVQSTGQHGLLPSNYVEPLPR